MNNRLELHKVFVEILGSKNVYFQPPPTLVMKYPCIVYSMADIDTIYANNTLYNYTKAYMVSVIYANPDSLIPDKILNLPLCRFDRHYTMDNLNHDVFTIYY